MNISRKGIILAGGSGTRLAPITNSMSKQLMPVYDKPMIYYPLSTLMLTGIREILIIVNPSEIQNFKKLLGDGSQLGISIKYKIQQKPNGIAEAFLLSADFINQSPSVLILGDNLFHGNELIDLLNNANKRTEGSTIFAYHVSEPRSYGVIEFDSEGNPFEIKEKPLETKSNFAITGLYFYDKNVVEYSKQIIPSSRGELEISSINQIYLKKNNLNVELMGRGMTWLDTGTFDSLHQASSYIRTLELRQGLKVGCPEEIAWRNGWIKDKDLKILAEKFNKSGYGNYLYKIVNQNY